MKYKYQYRDTPCVLLSVIPCPKRVQDSQRKYKILFMFTDRLSRQVKIYSGVTQSYLHNYVTNDKNGYSPIKARLNFNITFKDKCLIYNDIEIEV